MTMFDKLAEVEKRFEEISQRLYDPAVVSDVERYKELMKETKALTPIVEKYREYKKERQRHDDALSMLDDGVNDREMRELIDSEIKQSGEQMERCAEELKMLLLPRDPNDDKNVIIEIRGCAGGVESALFAG